MSVPNFPPLRAYVFSVIDRWTRTHSLESPFLEVGCGTGALAAHLGRGGWRGVATDSSPAALEMAERELAGIDAVKPVSGGLEGAGDEPFRTAFVMDVLEHVRDDDGLLRQVAGKLAAGGALVLLVPVNPREWAQDDVVYGHFRRYEWREVEDKLAAAGLKLEESWNVTVPFMWLFRRIYLKLLKSGSAGEFQDSLTAASSFYNPWDSEGLLSWLGRAAARAIWWAPLFAVQDGFRSSRRGHAAMFLGRKPGA